MTRPTILLDIDGICSNFVQGVLDRLNEFRGQKYVESDVTQWEMVDALNLSVEMKTFYKRIVREAGFCASLQPYEGAVEGVRALREFTDVYAVTAPMNSDYWMCEREQWLIKHFGFDRKNILFTSAKELVSGDVLIEDKMSTLIEWRGVQLGIPVLFDRPWNRKDTFKGPRVKDWSSLVSSLRFWSDLRNVR